MKYSLLAITVTASLALCPATMTCQAQTGIATAATQQPQQFTIMTWNLEWFFDEYSGDNISKLAREKKSPSRELWNWRRDAIASRIAQVRPTVLAAQEVENRRVLYYLCRALARNHQLEYDELATEGRDFYTEQDVGFIYRPPVDADSIIQKRYPKSLRSSNRFYDVSKHLIAILDFHHPDGRERLYVMNVHLRSRPEGEAFRLRQARLIHHWVREVIQAGQNVVLLGDFNSEERGDQTRPESELGIAAGLETPDTTDDLIDLTLNIPVAKRQTHLLAGRQFDRILCSRSLLDDDPSRPDLVFKKIEVLPALAIQGEQDLPEPHFESYWSLPQDQRDLSDHFPVMATFEIK